MAGKNQVRTKAKAPVTGSLAPPLRGGYYAVRPGSPDGPEYFGPTLDGMNRAVSRAGWLSVAGPDQQVTVSREALRAPKVIFGYAGGRCTMRPACVIPAQPARAPA